MRVLLACTVLSATAHAANYRFGAAQDRVVSDEPHGYTQHITPDFEVQDGIAVTYVRVGSTRVARLVSTSYAAKVYTDVAPLDGADGKITAGDAWISQQASIGALSLAATPTAVDRLLLSGARRLLYELVPTTVYFAHDQLGSMTVETDDQGAVVGRRAYSTWGGERASTGDGDSYGFTGQRQDDGGTVHFSFRQLDAATGRWSSTDPAFHVATPDGLRAFGEATTSYAYVANNPSNHVDPTGLGVVETVKAAFKAGWHRVFGKKQEEQEKPLSAGKQGKGPLEVSDQKRLEGVGNQLRVSVANLNRHAEGIARGDYMDEASYHKVELDVKGTRSLLRKAAALDKEGAPKNPVGKFAAHEIARSPTLLTALANGSRQEAHRLFTLSASFGRESDESMSDDVEQ